MSARLTFSPWIEIMACIQKKENILILNRCPPPAMLQNYANFPGRPVRVEDVVQLRKR